MHTFKRKLLGWPALAVAALCLAACGGPLGPFAGGELSGTSAEPPASWRSVPETIQLEVRPQAPYSVNVWSIGIGPHLYVATGKEGSSWLSYLQADANGFPGVVLGVAETVPGVSNRGVLPAGADPVRFGASDTLTFSPLGTATSGTVYLHDRSGRQFAVRVLGATGRTRILEFDAAAASWVSR